MEPSFPLNHRQGTGLFRASCVVLGVVALAQGAAVAMAWKERSHAPVLAKTPPPPLIEPAVPKVADPFSEDSVSQDPHPELAGPAGAEPVFADPAETVLSRPAAPLTAPLDVPITDEACLGFLDEGIYLRERGDMQGALKELRQALDLAPDHPKLIYQVALTLDGMSLERKAAVHWRQLRLLGQEAGNYYQMAVNRLKDGGSLPSPEELAPEAEEVKEGRFVVSAVKVDHPPDSAAGEVLMIEGRIDRKQPEPADVAKIGMKLHLFDEINGQRIDRIFGEDPPINWLDEPVDWKDGSERFVFTFRRPPLSPDELVRMGQRKYYGYALELRYGASEEFKELALQDLVAEPAFLAGMARDIPEVQAPPAGGETFDPLAPAAVPGQPDAVLFPGDKMDR